MTPPQDKIPLIAWLCGAPTSCYTTSLCGYEEKIRSYYDKRTSDIYYEWEEISSSYCFMWTRRSEPWAKDYCVAYFISEAISMRKILELVNAKGVYPAWYNFQLLSERFGVTKEVFESAQKKEN